MCERDLRIKTTARSEYNIKQKEEAEEETGEGGGGGKAGMLLTTNTLQTSERLALEYKIANTYTLDGLH